MASKPSPKRILVTVAVVGVALAIWIENPSSEPSPKHSETPNSSEVPGKEIPPSEDTPKGPTKEEADTLIRSAQGGNDVAQAILASDYFWGAGPIPKDYRQAVHWARLSASQGNHSAAELLESIKTIAAVDPMGVYSKEARQQMTEALEAP